MLGVLGCWGAGGAGVLGGAWVLECWGACRVAQYVGRGISRANCSIDAAGTGAARITAGSAGAGSQGRCAWTRRRPGGHGKH